MSSTKPIRLGAPEPEQHVVLMVVSPHRDEGFTVRDIEVFRGPWDAVQGVWLVLEGARLAGDIGSVGPELVGFCVRSVDDPRVHKAIRGDRLHGLNPGSGALLDQAQRMAHNAFRNYTANALGRIARDAVADESLSTLSAVRRRVREDANRLGLKPASYDFDRAIKSRIIVGRESSGYGRQRGKAYFLRKKDGPLHSVKINGRRLAQTTLAFQGEFHRLVPERDQVSA